MINWDTEDGAKINEELARLRGWTLKENWDYFSWFDTEGNYICDSSDLPDISGSNSAAIEAAEWMKERGWSYEILQYEKLGYSVVFWTPFTASRAHKFELVKLSEAIARAMGKALEREAE